MKRIMTLAAAAIALGLLANCVPLSYVQTGTRAYDPRPEDCPVQIYSTKTPEKYEEIGIAETHGGSLAKRYEVVRKKACEVGGNGIIPGAENVSISSMPVTQYHTATNNSGGMINYSTTSTQVQSTVTQKFTIIHTQE